LQRLPSSSETEVLHQPAPRDEYRSPHITIGETELKNIPQLTYMGCTITLDAKIDKEIDKQTGKGKQCFWQTLQESLEHQASEEEHQDQC
jgi:hypothetical protein